MIAVVDETNPEIGGGMVYSVVAGIVIADEALARAELAQVIPGRKRPFHWSEEGHVARTRMVNCLSNINVLGKAVAVQCGRRGQERARARALAAIVTELIASGCERLIIESRDRRQDENDRAVILDTLKPLAVSKFAYEWRPKREPLLWIADAIGGGVREHLVGNSSQWFERIESATGLTITYLNAP